MEATSLRFATAARALSQAARAYGLAPPGFRSPPRLADVDRSLRRIAGGAVLISVRLRGRPWIAVVSDMIEGVLVANGLAGATADAARRHLWTSLDTEGLLPARAAPDEPVPAGRDGPTWPGGAHLPATPPRASPARTRRTAPPDRVRPRSGERRDEAA